MSAGERREMDEHWNGLVRGVHAQKENSRYMKQLLRELGPLDEWPTRSASDGHGQKRGTKTAKQAQNESIAVTIALMRYKAQVPST